MHPHKADGEAIRNLLPTTMLLSMPYYALLLYTLVDERRGMSPAHLHKHGIDLAKLVGIFEQLPGQRDDLAADGQILVNTLLDGAHSLFPIYGTPDKDNVGVVGPL